MKDLIYFRTKRVGSSAFYGGLRMLDNKNYIRSWWGKTHMPVTRVKKLCIQEKSMNYWNQSIKVVGIRNPWSQQVSRFLMLSPGDNHMCAPGTDITTADGLENLICGFREYMKRVIDINGNINRKLIHSDYSVENWKIHADGNKSLADVFIRLEDLEGSLRNLATHLECEPDDVLKCFQAELKLNPKKKEHVNRYNWKDFYDIETKNIVYKLRKKEINFFKYKF